MHSSRQPGAAIRGASGIGARQPGMIAVLLIPLLAGCLSGSGGSDGDRPLVPATLACVAGVCNFEATVDPVERQANELSIAVNPTDPLNIIASGKDYTPNEAGDCVRDGLYVTHDGGKTWANSNVPGSPWRLFSDDPSSFEAHPQLSTFWCVTDPVVAFGPDGTAYWTVMPYQCDRLSGSKTGREFVPGSGVGLPDGGLNDWFWTCSAMYVLASTDGGDTWPTVSEVAFGPRLEHDKQWMSVSPSGVVLLCWDRDPSYQATSIVDAGANPAQQLVPGGLITCATSRDRAVTWTDPVDANRDWTGFFPWVDWDTDNHAWMAALDGSHVVVSHSEDGLGWGAPMTVGEYVDPPAGGEYGWPVLNGSDFRTFALPSLAVDRTDGPFAGSVYVAWFDHSSGDGEILFTYSRDHGASWSPPTRVHDDAPGSGFDQFMPSVSVGPDGTVDVTFYDRREDPANHLFDLFYTYSLDGGATFAPNLRVSAVSSDEQFSHHQNGMVFLGDYLDLDSSPGQAHAVWTDTRNAQADVYVANIQRPSANAMP